MPRSDWLVNRENYSLNSLLILPLTLVFLLVFIINHDTLRRTAGSTRKMKRGLTRTEIYSLAILSGACLSILINAWKSDGEPLFSSLAISGLAFAFSYALVSWTGDVFIQRGYKGRDMSKKNPVVL